MINKSNSPYELLDKIFMQPPSLFSLISGSLIGAAINILTGLSNTPTIEFSLIFVAFFLLLSSIPLFKINLILEDIRSMGIQNNALYVELKRDYNRIRLRKYLILFIIFLMVSLVILIYNLVDNSLDQRGGWAFLEQFFNYSGMI